MEWNAGLQHAIPETAKHHHPSSLQALLKHLHNTIVTTMIVPTTNDSLDACLKIIRKNTSRKVSSIAETDFDKVKAWIEAFQKYKPFEGL